MRLYILVGFLLLALVNACKPGSESEAQVTSSDGSSVGIDNDSACYWLDMVADTAVALHAGEADTAYYRLAVMSLFDETVFTERPWRYSGYATAVASLIHVFSWNGSRVVALEYSGYMFVDMPVNSDHVIAAYVIDTSGHVVTEEYFPGCHYHNGELTTQDIDPDGIEELKFRLVYPTQSVPVEETFEEYYALVKDSLVKRFSITTDERRAGLVNGVEDGEGRMILRSFKHLAGDRIIRVDERTYRFPADSFLFEDEIKTKTLLAREKHDYRFSADSMRYVLLR